MDLFVGPTHRTVFWLGAADARHHQHGHRRGELDKVCPGRGEEAQPRRRVRRHLRCSRSRRCVLAHDPRREGRTITARIGDGVHFTADGAEYLGRRCLRARSTRSGTSPSRPTRPPDRMVASPTAAARTCRATQPAASRVTRRTRATAAATIHERSRRADLHAVTDAPPRRPLRRRRRHRRRRVAARDRHRRQRRRPRPTPPATTAALRNGCQP